MRRKDREVTDFHQIAEIIEACQCCRLGFCDEGRVYIVPLNFGYDFHDGHWVFYFHSAKEGRKIDLMEKNPYVGFEMDTNYQLNEGQMACQYSARFQSLIGEGKLEVITDNDQKQKALLTLMKHYTHHDDWTFHEKMLESVCVFQMIVSEISCKEHL